MKLNKKKLQVKICGLLIWSMAILAVSSCQAPKNKSSLQILGFKDNVLVEAEGEPITLYLAYGFNRHGILQINRLSKNDFDNSKSENPIETRVGQFGLFTLAYVLNNDDLIRKGSISYNASFFFGNQPENIPNFGEETNLENQNGQQIMELHRDLKLFEFINRMHELGKERFGVDFYSLDELKEDSEIIFQKPLVTLRLNLVFDFETKSGKKGQNEIKLILRPAKLFSL